MLKHEFLTAMTQPPTHPGQVLAAVVLPAIGMNPSDAARRVSMSESDFRSLLAGDYRIDAATADRIGELCGNGPGLWLNMQAVFDAWIAYHRPEPESGGHSFTA